MSNTIELQKFLSNKRILHDKTAHDFNDALKLLIENIKDTDIDI